MLCVESYGLWESLASAYVAGDIEGDVFATLAALRDVAPSHVRFGLAAAVQAVIAANHVNAFGKPLPPPPEEISVKGYRHSRRRDARAISHHYDLSNEFYRLLLGPSMTYSWGPPRRVVWPASHILVGTSARAGGGQGTAYS